ncbi:ubiquitin-specific protease doa4, partial [Teratosphaeriaceae sp. CCFEE 6253]
MSTAATPLPPPTAGPPPRPPSSTPNAGERIFDHIEDLKAEVPDGFNPAASIPILLTTAQTCLEQAQSLNTTFRRPDLAFVEFIRASEIVVDVIPRHRDYVHFTIDQVEPAKRLGLLRKRVAGGNEQFAAIKGIIVNNNTRYGTKPTGTKKDGLNGANVNGGHVRTESAPVHGLTNGATNGAPPKVRPTPSPKPEGMHGRALVPSAPRMNGAPPPSTTDLSQRFAQLRTNTTMRPDSRGSDTLTRSPVAMPTATDYTGRNSFEPLARTSGIPYKPLGPRGMPNGAAPGAAPPLAQITIPNLPQAPQAAYSPARNMDTGGQIAPPRHTARSLGSRSTRRSSMVPGSSASAPGPGGEGGDYFPNGATTGFPSSGSATSSSSRRSNAPIPRRTSTTGPIEHEISPEKLYDYNQRYHLLLIDVRAREAFDQGHIYTRQILCVDPLALRPGMSAEEVGERLVLSADAEQEMWRRRGEYDFVVYYDQATQNVASVCGGLRWLREALAEFNSEGVLKRPPVLLRGGLEAWVEMTGRQALATSESGVRRVGKGRQVVGRKPIGAPSAAQKIVVPKRRLRDYNPLDAEEEQYWRERARQESVVLPLPPAEASEDGAHDDAGEGNAADASSAIAEFLARFPDAGDLDRQAFASQRPTRAPPDAPTSIPSYPPPPTASPYNSTAPPARPAPAAPRMSYQGVSDRTSAPTSRHTPGTQMLPYTPPRLLPHNLRLPRTGLINFRNTCYMNSILQALSATTPLTEFLLQHHPQQPGGYKTLLQPDNWKGSADIGYVTAHYANLLGGLWKDDVAALKPTTFRSVLRRKWADFDNDAQQDAKEFLDVLLEFLHQDLNVHWANSLQRPLTAKEEVAREQCPPSYVARYEW